ncbi:MAG: ATP synthase F1 subunit delta [Patescibacteria group bacterium]
MKVTAGQYAKALYELTRDKSQEEIGQIVSDFSKMLRKNKQLRNSAKIIQKFEELSNRENGIIEAVVTSREKLSSESLKKIEGFIKEKYGAKKVALENKIDEKIIGGVIIKVGNEIIDGSLNRQLKNLSKFLINS